VWTGGTLAQEPAPPAAEPTLVSLHLRNAPLESALKELTKQTGFEIFAKPEDGFGAKKEERKITIDVDRLPYWEVVRQVCVQSGWRPVRYEGEGARLLLYPSHNDWSKRPVNQQGQFMVMVSHIGRHESLEFDNPNGAKREFVVSVDVFADPKLKIIGKDYLIDVAVATDDKGNSLVLKAGKQDGFLDIGRQDPLLHLQAPLQTRPDNGSKLVELKGVARLSVLTKSERWDLGHPLKITKEQQRVVNEKETLTVRSVAPAPHNPTEIEVKIAIAIEDAPDPNLPRPRHDVRDLKPRCEYLQECLTIVDAQGRRFPRGFLQSASGNGNTWEYSLTFSPPDGQGLPVGEPAGMIWDVPVEITEVEVPVEFHDLPLP
jgi:hypothetical protein